MLNQKTHEIVTKLPLNEVYELAEMMVWLRDKSIETTGDDYIKGVAVCDWDGEGCGYDVNGDLLCSLLRLEMTE